MAIFPGSFDPFTKGHEDIVLRGLKLFDSIIIAIGYNQQKSQRYFDVHATVNHLQRHFADQPAIGVAIYAELTAEFAKRHNATFLLRGLRNTTDFEYENVVAQANRHFNADLESVFLITSPHLAAISSSLVREIHHYGGDVSPFLPYPI